MQTPNERRLIERERERMLILFLSGPLEQPPLQPHPPLARSFSRDCCNMHVRAHKLPLRRLASHADAAGTETHS